MKVEAEVLKYPGFWNEWYKCFEVVPDDVVYLIVFVFAVENDDVTACLVGIDIFECVEKSVGSVDEENVCSSHYVAENDAE